MPLLTLALACAPVPDRRDLLPAAVAVGVDTQDGRQLSVVVRLDDPERPPQLRYAPSALRVDGAVWPSAPIESTVRAQGPGQGFGVTRSADEVTLALPLRHQPLVLVDGVAALRSVELLTASQLSDESLDPFGIVSMVLLTEGQALADGDLEEWRGSRSLAVDSRGHVREGLTHWSGPRDGALAIVGRIDGPDLVLALRVRDDALLPGQDRIEVQTLQGAVSLPVQGAGVAPTPAGAHAVFTESVEFGTGLELSLPAAWLGPQGHGLLVRYVDVDPGEPGTTLASSPSLQALADVPAAGPPPRIVEQLQP
ncbi:MAG: hypothetical protein VX899_08785 [Myxococcota bacterium]|nr:hypothetical protein [Myxococcota bacterium]